MRKIIKYQDLENYVNGLINEGVEKKKAGEIAQHERKYIERAAELGHNVCYLIIIKRNLPLYMHGVKSITPGVFIENHINDENLKIIKEEISNFNLKDETLLHKLEIFNERYFKGYIIQLAKSIETRY